MLPIHRASATTIALVPVDEQTDADAKIAAERFLTVLIRNPRFGTAFDRVYEYYIDRGSIAAFLEQLRVAAKLPENLIAEAGSVTPDMATLSLPSTINSGVACQLFGMIQLKHSEAAFAVAALQQAVQQRPKDAVAHWSLAQALILAHRPDDAITSLEKAIDCRPAKTDLLEIYRQLARTQQRTKNPEAVLATWRRLEQEFPGDLRVRELIAVTLSEDGRWNEALTQFQALAKETRNPDQRIQANLSASDVLIQLGRSQDAIALLESQLGELDSDSWLSKEIRRRIENIFRSREDLPGLAVYYEAWIRKHPEDIDAMARLAHTLSLQNRTADASDWYRKAIQRAPSNVPLREAFIEQLVRDNQLADAISQYEQMAQFDAGNPDHIERWGQLYLSQKEVPLEERQRKASTIWERLLAGREKDPVTLARLASLVRRAELRERAIALYQSAIENAPDEPQYREYLGEYLHQLQRTVDAVAVWKQIAEGDRRSKASLIRLAEVLQRFGEIEPATEAMRDACRLNPEPMERLQFAEMLRTRRAAGRQPSESPLNTDAPLDGKNTESDSEGSRPPLAEAIEQLDLAEQSAETADERQQILRERIKCLIDAGQLEVQTKMLVEELKAGTSATADRWRTLALYQDAANNLNDATASAMKVVEREPESISGWTILADLYERTGRLGDAAEATKKLATLDRRGISGYLRKVARLQIRLGQFDAALGTGRDVIKAAPGNPEAYQFFADLAFEVGQPQVAVESLRQAVRVNPGDEASLQALAKTLADEFQTPEAIELYWRAFEKAPDLESQTNIVVALSDLYLRSSQFEKLISRLEIRSRELNLPIEMTRCIATAYREAGDFHQARETLQKLEIEGAADLSLLRLLLTLSLQEQNIPEAIEYQKEIVEETSNASDVDQLANLLRMAGRDDESRQVRLDYGARDVSMDSLRKVIEGPFRPGDVKQVTQACRTYLDRFPDDWAVLTTLACLLDETEQRDEACEVAARVLLLNSAPEARGSLAVLPVLYPRSSEIQRRSDLASSLYGVPPASFLDAYIRCCDLIFLHPTHPQDDLLPAIFQAEVLQRLGTVPIIMVADHLDAASPCLETFLDHLKAAGEASDTPLTKRLLLQIVDSDTRIRLGRSGADHLIQFRARLTEKLPMILQTNPDFFQLNHTVSRIAAIFHGDEAAQNELLKRLRATPAQSKTETTLGIVTAFAFIFHDFAGVTADTAGIPALPANRDSADFFTVLDQTWQILPQHLAMHATGFTDPEALLAEATLACRFNRLPDSALSSIVPEKHAQFAPLKNDFRLRLFADTKLQLELSISILSRQLGAETRIQTWADAGLSDADPLYRARVHLLLAGIGSAEQRLLHLIRAAEEMPRVPGLRFDVAVEAARRGLTAEAIRLLDSIQLTDPASGTEIELKALEWSLAAGNRERGIVAAKRLFGLPLTSNQQLILASVLSQLGMNEELIAVNSRLSRGTETRQSVLAHKLRTYTAQGKNDLAGEVAWELLKLASGGSLFSGQRPNDDRDDGGERLQALNALGKLKRLQPLIDRYEAMLAASPESVDLLEILAEFHEAAEQWDELAEKRDRIALLSKKAPPSLKAKAVALENSGDVSGACDIYLRILKDDPEAFKEEMETYVQSFERAKRQADFLTAVLSQDPEHWSGNGQLLVNVIAGLSRAKTNEEVVQKSIETMVANEPARRLAIGGFLARPDVVREEKLLPSIQSELESNDSSADFSRVNELFLILQGLKNESSLKTVREFLIRRAAGRQPSEQSQEVPQGSRPPLAGVSAAVLLIYIDARLGSRGDVESRVTELVGAARQEPRDFELVALNARLRELGSDWDIVRLTLLEHLAGSEKVSPDFADMVLEELGTVYASLGRLQKARGVLNRRVQRILASPRASNENASESIRQLLQAGEKIQHSGFPIEGARLLLNVTPYDIDRFTSDLDNDKAIAFKSRFNASQRWARQQISAEKLVSWFETAVQQPDSAIGHSDLDIGHSDLLLELSGTTDPRTRDVEAMRQLRVESVLLNVIAKQSFDSVELQEQISAAITALLAQETETPDLRLLGVGLALAEKLRQPEQVQRICKALSASAGRTSPPVDTARTTDAVGRPSFGIRIPEALRSQPELTGVLIARLLTSQNVERELTSQLLQRSAAAAERCPDRLVKIAFLQECADVAKLVGLTPEVATFTTAASAAIADQIKATSLGIEGTIDFSHEIRTRLLHE